MARALLAFCLDSTDDGDIAAGATLTVGVNISAEQAVALAAAGHIALEALSADPAPDPAGVLAAAGAAGAVRIVALGGFSLGGGADVGPGDAFMVNEATADLWVKQGRAVRAPAMSLAYAGLETLAVGDTVAAAVTVTNGVAPFSFAVLELGDGLAPGLEISAGSGAISGEPTETFDGSATIRVTDALGDSADVEVPQVVAAAVTILPAALAEGAEGVPYSEEIVASGGFAPYAYTAVGMPSGMTLDDETGALEWDSPLAAGSPHGFTVTATDAVGHTASVVYSLAVTE